MASLGDLVVNIKANNKGFNKGIKQSTTLAQKFGKAMKVGVGAAIVGGTAAAAAGIAIVNKNLGDLDKTAKLAAQTGFAAEEIAGFGLAAQISGASVETANKGLQIFTRRMGEAAGGTGEASTALKEMGFNVEELLKLRPAQQLGIVADAISRLPTEAEQANAAFALMGRGGMDLVNTLKLGSSGLSAFNDEAAQLGMAFSNEELKNVEAANDAITRLTTQLVAFGAVFTVHVAPAIETAVKHLTSFVEIAAAAFETGGDKSKTLRLVKKQQDEKRMEQIRRIVRGPQFKPSGTPSSVFLKGQSGEKQVDQQKKTNEKLDTMIRTQRDAPTVNLQLQGAV